MSNAEPLAVLAELWLAAGGEPTALSDVNLDGPQHTLPSSFAVDTIAHTSIAAAGLAAAQIWHHRTGRRQRVRVNRRHASIEFRSERYVRTATPPPELWDRIAGLYRARNDAFVRLHTNFAHHRDGILALLGCAYDREAVQAALANRDAVEFETEAAAHGLVVTATRDRATWTATPQGQAVATLPLLEITRIGDAPPLPFATAPTRPLSGVRVLDLTRIIAGPVAARTLAAHGADVLHISSPQLPSIPILVMDTGRGKRTAFLDLNQPDDHQRLHDLALTADVFLQGYRPGGLASRGFSPEALAASRPGIICASLSAFGRVGPWADRRGFDSLTQNANGLNVAEAQALTGNESWDRPKELPAQALDHAVGHVLAFGIQMALLRRATVGGSWLVSTSLAQVGEWLWSLPRVADGHATPDPTFETMQDLLDTTDSGFGPLTAVRHAAELSETPAHYATSATPLGAGPAAWI